MASFGVFGRQSTCIKIAPLMSLGLSTAHEQLCKCIQYMRTLDQQHADALGPWTASAHCGGEKVRPDSVRDPLLLARNNVMIAILFRLCTVHLWLE